MAEPSISQQEGAARRASSPGELSAQHRIRARAPRDQRPTAGGWRAVLAGLIVSYRRYWNGTVVSSFLTPLLYLGGMGFGLGALVNANSGGIDGLPYVTFVAPGVLASTALQVGLAETTYSVVGGIKWQRTYHAIIATPAVPRDIVSGVAAFTTLRVLFATTVYFLVAAAFGTVSSPLGVLAVLVSTLGGLAFAMPVMAYSAQLENEAALNIVFRFIVMPMTLFSATFFPLSQLPGWATGLAWVTPLWHAVDGSRMLTTGQVDWPMLAVHVVILAGFTVVGYLLAVRNLTKRLVV
jgi:lipooligosaccharide transport system permease protein